ncbi:substrate-binding periplasmic protein [Ketogulonicigenium vulgare]|uniref:Extracellular solute-binding protein, family 3 n=1 Tax=Ketogulonicigenium vulgare (strain WSH-001) TaxID=759362 RepID=F9Y5R5_KETVW|nr:transporter substrate-binding domain-containing protein [Ketogulonicigenium vulgare]ADO43726.1 extracellular solute-binding protein [Ketogulonicigenium vulgare Y25]AEM41990.1 Extracellular solute-binding protein, family 3 [Ketogulonicigenium vulgare WSH-001]ALJ82089.1 ABC transporter substrate-binding protein [Ketogulonicigenium vulgare]ANW34713.1 ABC transporter substrate-binding protein [Ketogulonicigenium vulgare]AOZ55758.1 extracellular solute-binding protein [Ketogulonicigenium vulgare
MANPRMRAWKGFVPLAVCFAVLFGAGFLPPDTSLSQIDKAGRISVCIPQVAPPMVTGQAAAPGFDVDLVTEIARRAGWQLSFSRNAAMTRDINPRSWHITRAQCQMVAGGVVLSDTTRSYMDTSEGYLQAGWALIATAGAPEISSGDQAGFLAGLSGLNRITLGQHLRSIGVSPVVVNNVRDLRGGLDSGRFVYAITDAFTAQANFSEDEGYDLGWVPGDTERFALGFGFWKGDMTLRRHVEGLLDDIRADGTFAMLAQKYDLDPALYCGDEAINEDGTC